MITDDELKQHGYSVVNGHIRLDASVIPNDWYDLCKDFCVDPDCKEIILAVCGVKEIYEDEDMIHPSFDPVLRNET